MTKLPFSAPAVHAPPAICARSATPTSPNPAPTRPDDAVNGFDTSMVRPSPGRPDSVTRTGADTACLRALVSPSWTMR